MRVEIVLQGGVVFPAKTAATDEALVSLVEDARGAGIDLDARR